MNTTPETNSKKAYIELEAAEGSIEAGSGQQERLEEFTERVSSGEFHVTTDKKVPKKCIDGRRAEGMSLAPNSAGGTETLFVADDLTTKRFSEGTDGTTRAAYANTLRFVSAAGEEVGGHTDEHPSEDGSGCGANDKLGLVYAFIAKNGQALRETAKSLGITVSDDDFNTIMGNADARAQFSKGSELLGELNAYGEDAADKLVGAHNEVVAVINTKEGTTLDREAVEAEFGPNYQSFNVDAWSFKHGAELISESPEEVEAKVFAMALYNLATAHVLCGKKMRVVVL